MAEARVIARQVAAQGLLLLVLLPLMVLLLVLLLQPLLLLVLLHVHGGLWPPLRRCENRRMTSPGQGCKHEYVFHKLGA